MTTHEEKVFLAEERRQGARAIIGMPFPEGGDGCRGLTGRRRARRYSRKVHLAFREELLVRFHQGRGY